MYYRPETQEVFATHSDIRNALSNVMFASVIADEDLAYNGVFLLTYEKPEAPAGQVAVPLAVENIDGAWTQLWTVRDATPEEMAAAVPVVPQRVTRRQARQALLLAGLLDDVPLAIAAIPDETQRRLAEIEWEDSLEFERARPLVIQIASALGLDAAALDQMFITAATL